MTSFLFSLFLKIKFFPGYVFRNTFPRNVCFFNSFADFFFLITLTLKFFKAIDLRVLDLEETPDICYPMCYLT